jgi:1-acyl-sn-glycerol-3-phosphate acyltransferase
VAEKETSILALFRGYVFLAFVGVVTFVLGVLGFPLLLIGERAARRIMLFWTRLVIWALKFFCGVTHRIEGAENIPDGPAIIAANHQSMWETISLVSILPNPSMVFKRELESIPIYGFWASGTGHIMVDRGAGARAIRSLKKQAAARIAAGSQVVIFPEGTRTESGEIKPLQPGVAAIYNSVEAPVVPVAHDSGKFWRHPGHAKYPGVITMRFLPAIPSGLDRKVFMKRLEKALIEARPDLDPRLTAATVSSGYAPEGEEAIAGGEAR